MPIESSSPLMLSVSGARGIVGESMTPAVATDFAAAFGSYALAACTPDTSRDHRTVCLGRDTRPSSETLSAAAAMGLAAVGARVVDLGVAATPTVGVMVDELETAGVAQTHDRWRDKGETDALLERAELLCGQCGESGGM